MTQFVSNAQDSETFSLYAGIRQAELNAQDWDQEKSAHLARNGSIGNSTSRVEASTCMAFLPAARLRKAAALPTCAHRQTPPTFRLAPAIEKFRFGWHEEFLTVGH
jgi:hypothetical protein